MTLSSQNSGMERVALVCGVALMTSMGSGELGCSPSDHDNPVTLDNGTESDDDGGLTAPDSLGHVDGGPTSSTAQEPIWPRDCSAKSLGPGWHGELGNLYNRSQTMNDLSQVSGRLEWVREFEGGANQLRVFASGNIHMTSSFVDDFAGEGVVSKVRVISLSSFGHIVHSSNSNLMFPVMHNVVIGPDSVLISNGMEYLQSSKFASAVKEIAPPASGADSWPGGILPSTSPLNVLHTRAGNLKSFGISENLLTINWEVQTPAHSQDDVIYGVSAPVGQNRLFYAQSFEDLELFSVYAVVAGEIISSWNRPLDDYPALSGLYNIYVDVKCNAIVREARAKGLLLWTFSPITTESRRDLCPEIMCGSVVAVDEDSVVCLLLESDTDQQPPFRSSLTWYSRSTCETLQSNKWIGNKPETAFLIDGLGAIYLASSEPELGTKVVLRRHRYGQEPVDLFETNVVYFGPNKFSSIELAASEDGAILMTWMGKLYKIK